MTPLAPPFGHPRSGRKGFVPRRPILGTVADLAATAGDGQVVVTFSTPVGATHYLPQYKASASGTWLDAGDPNDPASITDASVDHTITGLTNTTAYDFRAVVYDPHTSTTSNTDSATPSAGSGFGTVNDLAVKATQTDTTLEFEWTQVSDDLGNPAKYAVRIRTPTLDENTWAEAFDTEIFVDTSLAIGVTKSVQFTGLDAGTDYEAMLIPFRGTSGDADAFGSFSNSAAGTTTGSSSLGTISDLAATPANAQVSLTWSPASNATSHQPQYKLSSSGTWLDFGSALGASASNVVVTGLTNDSSYDFRIEAGDGVTTTTSNVETATPTDTSSAYPNEPAGFTVVREWDGSALVPSEWDEAGTSQPIQHSREPEGGLPGGKSHLYRHTYPGNNPNIGGSGTEFLDSGTPWFRADATAERIYIHFYIRPSANWHGHSSTTNKVIYWGADSFFHMFFRMHGSDDNALRPGVTAQNLPEDNSTFAWRDQNSSIPRGQFTEVEILVNCNTVGNEDGTFKVWLDETLVLDESGTGKQYRWAADRDQFIGAQTNSIWGGIGDQLSADQELDIVDLRISVGPR